MSADGAAIAPHGGRLVDRVAAPGRVAELRAAAARLPQLELSTTELADLALIAVGALSPLTGFVGRADYERILGDGRLAGGLPWTLPITLAVPPDAAARLGRGATVALVHEGTLYGALTVADVFARDPTEARQIYGTDDARHPGVAWLAQRPPTYVGGAVELVTRPAPPFAAHHHEPAETRAAFVARGWRRIVAFQTRNPIHRAHEYLTKVALEAADGLLLHPLVGPTKDDDLPADVRMRCYEALLGRYYPTERVLLSTLPAAMRYAGPKEAVFHALVRKNYGCTHFIVGRDHAGVGDFYGDYDAQRAFDRYSGDEIGIVPLRYENSFHCKECAAMASSKTCPHDEEARVRLSGSQLRALLRAGQTPPPELCRPEVARILIDAMKAE